MSRFSRHGRSTRFSRVKGCALAALVTAMAVMTPSAMAMPEAPAAVRAVGVDEHPGARVPLDLGFTTSQGEPATLGQFFDGAHPVLLILAYNRCAMLCSLVLRSTADAVSRLDMRPGRDFRLVTVSIDPGETVQQAYRQQEIMLERIGLPGQPLAWPFLIAGDAAGDKAGDKAIGALARSLGFRYAWDERTEQYAHPAVVFAITPDGVISRYIHGVGFAPGEIASALRRAGAGRVDLLGDATGDAAGDATGKEGGGFLSCFRFASALGKYGPAIQLMFQVGALLILLALVGGLVVLIRRHAGTS